MYRWNPDKNSGTNSKTNMNLLTGGVNIALIYTLVVILITESSNVWSDTQALFMMQGCSERALFGDNLKDNLHFY